MFDSFKRYAIHTLLALFAALLVALPFGVATAKDDPSTPLTRIAQSGTIRVGMSGAQPPFNFTNRDGKIVGMDVDLARLLATALDVQLEIIELPFGDLLPALESGKVDLVISGMTATLQRNTRAAFVGPYYITGKTVLTRKETIAALKAEELNRQDLRIAALKGSTSEEYIQRTAPTARLVATDDYNQAIDKLLSDKADLFVADYAIIALSLLRWPDAGLVAADEPLTIEPIGIAVAPGDPLLVNLLENYLESVESSGALALLRKSWFEDGSWIGQLP